MEPKNAPTAFSQEIDFYSAQWKPSKAGDDGKTWRIFVLLGGQQVLAHRDVLVGDPSRFNPADGEELSVRANSNVNIKVAVTSESGIQVGTCSATDSDAGQTDEEGEEALCLIPAGTPGLINLGTTCLENPDGCTVETILGAQTFPLLIDVDAQCDGDIETDLPLYGPCVEMSADMPAGEELVESYIFFCNNGEPIGAPLGAFVLQQSDDLGEGTGGTLTLPAVNCNNGFAAASELDGFWDLITGGVEKVAGLFGARELVATSAVGHSGGGGSLRAFGSKFQLGGPAFLGPAERMGGGELPTVVQQDEDVNVVVPVYGGDLGGVAPGTTVYFFSTQGTGASGSPAGDVDCPGDNTGTDAVGRLTYDDGAVCDDGGDPVIYTTGSDSEARAVWTPGPSSSPLLGGTTVDLRMLCAGCAVEGSDTPINAGGSIDGLLQDAADRDRNPFGDTGFHNGPDTGLDEFQQLPLEHFTGNAVAHNDLAMVRSALVCGEGVAPQSIDGQVDDEWACAGDPKLKFIANLSGPKPKAPNAKLYAMDDGTDVYFGLEIYGTNEIADLFINFSQTGSPGSADAGDDLVLRRSDGTPPADMYTTDSCASSEGKSLCGADDPDPTLEAAAADNGDFIFYEFKKPRCSGETVMIDGAPLDVDFCLDSIDDLWAYLTLTGGKGGGKGSTIADGFREWKLIFGDGI